MDLSHCLLQSYFFSWLFIKELSRCKLTTKCRSPMAEDTDGHFEGKVSFLVDVCCCFFYFVLILFVIGVQCISVGKGRSRMYTA